MNRDWENPPEDTDSSITHTVDVRKWLAHRLHGYMAGTDVKLR